MSISQSFIINKHNLKKRILQFWKPLAKVRDREILLIIFNKKIKWSNKCTEYLQSPVTITKHYQ